MDKDPTDRVAAMAFRSAPSQARVELVDHAEDPGFWRRKCPAVNEGELGEQLKQLSDEEIQALFESVARNPKNWTIPRAPSPSGDKPDDKPRG